MRRFTWKKITIILCSFLAVFQFSGNFEPTYRERLIKSDVKDFKAFITSSYYYPKSQSLGDNALALVMNINDKRKYWFGKKWYEIEKKPMVTIRARNLTSSIIITTPYERVTSDTNPCLLPTVFITAQLLPNTISIELLGDYEQNAVSIPFSIPPSTKYDVVVCISPIFVAENWQTFLFAMHIYKKFGAFVNLYYISSIDSFFDLIRIYEESGYLTLQPWVTIKMIGVDKSELDPFQEIEFRNQAAAQTDCILKYKETAKFVTLVDMDDILIPKLAPTYLEEFEILLKNLRDISYLVYEKQNYHGSTVNSLENFSFSSMLGTLERQNSSETGKIVTDPKLMNYTWIHWTYQSLRKIEVQENRITHLKKLNWLEEIPKSNKTLNFQPMIIERSMEREIEQDWQIMREKVNAMLKKKLPEEEFYAKILGECYQEKFYSNMYYGAPPVPCSGPHFCEYPQRDDINCVHVDASYVEVPKMEPISFYFAVHTRLNSSFGCYP